MRSALAAAAQRHRVGRGRSASLSVVPPSHTSDDYLPELAAIAASILYLSPIRSPAGRPLYVLNAAAFPDAADVDYDSLLSYVLARLPAEEDLISGTEYEIVFFAGGQPDAATTEKKQGPGMGWYLQAYHVLSRATRKKLQKLYIVHPRTWVRVLIGTFGTVVSPKFRRKIVHDNTLTSLAEQIPIQKMLIPPAVYLHDRKLEQEIHVPGASGRRAFGVRHPLPKNIDTRETRLPRVLRETTAFILLPSNLAIEGLFRIPPHSTLQGVLGEAYERGQKFIVWKEQGATHVQPGLERSQIDQVRLEDAYGVHLAASLIKQWYRELRDPIFPESSYDFLRTKFSLPDEKVTVEGLEGLLSPQSDGSPLTVASRHILVRHLLPLLYEVALQEESNKMNPENLAICFSMCLVCGSSQLEDAKMSSVLKRILEAATEMWPRLREGMNIDPTAFRADLQPPIDPRDYEDPLEEVVPHSSSEHSPHAVAEGHRIRLEDSEEKLQPERAPKLPARHSPDLLVDQMIPAPHETTPIQSRRPSDPSTTMATAEAAATVPKRKPAPPVPEPPRYSTIFDTEGNSLHVDSSPSHCGPVDGFGPPRRSNWSVDDYDKKISPSTTATNADTEYHHPTIEVPKRKAIPTESKPADSPLTSPVNSVSPTDTTELARQAAHQAASNLAQHAEAAFKIDGRGKSTTGNNSTAANSESVPAAAPAAVLAEGDGIFRKPTWPASAPQVSLSKPLVGTPRQAHTMPLPAKPAISAQTATAPNLPVLPKPRVPSPGLLKRMSSIEQMTSGGGASFPGGSVGTQPQPRSQSLPFASVASETGAGPGTGPSSRAFLAEPPRGKLNLRKSSVDNLRRLYDERASTVRGLERASSGKSQDQKQTPD